MSPTIIFIFLSKVIYGNSVPFLLIVANKQACSSVLYAISIFLLFKANTTYFAALLFNPFDIK